MATSTNNGQKYFVAKKRLRDFYESEASGGAGYSDIGRSGDNLSAKTVAMVLKGGRCVRKTAVRILKGCSAYGYKGSLKDSFDEV